MFKVLILGARGNLGSQLIPVFKRDYEVIAWDRDEIDITDFKQLEKSVRAVEPDIIINAVAYNAVDKCEESETEQEKARQVNGEAVRKLAHIALELEALLVHYVSDYIFDGDNKEGYKEDAIPMPICKYGITKLLGEQAVLSLAEEGLKYYLIRSSKLFGPRGKSEAAKPSFFDIMLKLSKEKDEIDVVNAELSCFTYTPDLAVATLKLIEDMKPFGIYHITNTGPATWYEAAKEMFKIAGIDIKLNPVTPEQFPRPARRPRFAVLLNTKLEPLRSYQEALKEYLTKSDDRLQTIDHRR
ncbi:dTDP-4-dehydrorhamnose reductase [Candidatus Parcubacteria bacterium]|nr:dTDP-4-dehydrorhamnose reductase [Candidatus Parcubacteria bacterium]